MLLRVDQRGLRRTIMLTMKTRKWIRLEVLGTLSLSLSLCGKNDKYCSSTTKFNFTNQKENPIKFKFAFILIHIHKCFGMFVIKKFSLVLI